MLMLASEWVRAQEPIPNRVLDLEKTKCDQPGCANDAELTVRLKVQFSDHGEKLDASDGLAGWKATRRFCQKHQERGNSSREDSDDNYEVAF